MEDVLYKRIAKVACEHVHTKQECGSVLNRLAAKLSANDAAQFIVDIIIQDFFLDLGGTASAFFAEILKDDVRELALTLFKKVRRVNDSGDLVESDADSETGNLRCDDVNEAIDVLISRINVYTSPSRGFVCGDHEVSMDSQEDPLASQSPPPKKKRRKKIVVDDDDD